MSKYLLDTNTIIYALNQALKLKDGRYLVSVITEIELLSYANLTKSDAEVLKRLLSRFESIELTKSVKEKTIQIRKESKLKLPDSIIVASALDNNAILVTSDKQLLNAQIVKTIELHQI
ncbi:type II toxin-antitoxin system VapC family toxin [Sulfurimonas sp.]|uniref:type II toxin-antitoxin system VapC family toxin n=1 Tax=Sulfurimonas sp. TaxID=2022749 RepID=UPI003D0BED33